MPVNFPFLSTLYRAQRNKSIFISVKLKAYVICSDESKDTSKYTYIGSITLISFMMCHVYANKRLNPLMWNSITKDRWVIICKWNVVHVSTTTKKRKKYWMRLAIVAVQCWIFDGITVHCLTFDEFIPSWCSACLTCTIFTLDACIVVC